MSLEKATITGVGTDIKVTCLFNPKEYTISRTNEWKIDFKPGQNIPEVTFSGGKPAQLRMQLFFDTFELGTDVRKHTQGLWKLMRVDPDKVHAKTKKSEPPKVRFSWGDFWSFDAVLETVSQTFTLFLPTGVPVRSTVDVTFKQIKDEMKFAGTNPTSGGGEPHRVHVVQAGERLDWIAFQVYGDSTHWRPIAEANGLIRPHRLRPGQKLIIPAR